MEKNPWRFKLMVKKRREVEDFKYPVKAGSLQALATMFKPMPFLLLFHISMGLQLISGLIMDLAAPWIGGPLLRQFHGYIGAFFTIMFIVYVSIIAINKDFRALREPINYVEMVFFAALIIFGFALRFPRLLPFLNQITPFHCNLLTLGWVAVSVLGGGGIIQGLASMYYIIIRGKNHVQIGSKKEKEK
jgi:hypothetical protein